MVRLVLWSALAFLGCGGVQPVWGQTTSASSAESIPDGVRLNPEQLAATLRAKGTHLLVLQVGSRVLFDEAHIAGAEYAGPAGQPQGLAALRSRVRSLPKSQAIVLYCGCCPWDRCPNIGPAYRALSGMGFTNLRVLYLAHNFGDDWVNRGFPSEKGQ